jgi:hypothetical protein
MVGVVESELINVFLLCVIFLHILPSVVDGIQYLMRVPIFKEQRYHSIPLPTCSASPYNPKDASPINIVRHVDGQFLSGDMVPTRPKEIEEDEKEKLKREKATTTVAVQQQPTQKGGGVNNNNNNDEITLTISEGGTVETIPLLKAGDVVDSKVDYGAV